MGITCSFLLLSYYLLVSPSTKLASTTIIRGNSCIDSIYSFGDSLSDTGNLLREINGSGPFGGISKYPYGMSLVSDPTGRCSNGLLILDFLARRFHVPLVPPYLDHKADFRSGVNFAVAGATALDVSFFVSEGIPPPITNSSLGVQLEWFKTHKASICPKNDCPGIFDRSLFFVGEIGGNDFNYAFFGRKSIDKLMSYTPLVVNRVIHVAQEVIEAGAVRLVIPGNFPIGCTPSYLSSVNTSDPTAYDNNGCLKGLNAFADYYNQQLKKAIEVLRNGNKGVMIIYADYYRALMDIITNARNYGFDEDSKLRACCGVGGRYNFNATTLCGKPGTKVCRNPRRSISWDGIHLTQAAYQVIARGLVFDGYSHPSRQLLREQYCI